MADNFHFDITGAPLADSLAIAAGQHRTAAAWRVEDRVAVGDLSSAYGADKQRPRLILYWVEKRADNIHPLPAPLRGDALVGFVRTWLEEVDYGPEPKIDGSSSKGWRVYCEAWGHVADEYQAFVAIEPVWLMHGK